MNIPTNWEEAPLENLLIHVIGGDWGKAIDSVEDADEFVQVSCIRGAEFRHWDITKGNTASLRLIKKNSLTNRKLQLNDILLEISGGGPEQPVGRTVLIDKTCLLQNANTPKVCTNFLRLIRPSSIFNSSYLNYYLKYFYFTGEVTKYQAGSNNLRNLKFKNYVGIIIPAPPLKEQHRIVNKIETLFSKLDKGIESLKTAQEQLKLYRQALLKHAFEGKLTEQWRKDNADKLETAEELLARIKQEREKRYQQQLEDWEKAVEQWEAEGKDGKKSRKPPAYKELPAISTEELSVLPKLPTDWSYLRLAEIARIGSGMSVSKDRELKKPIEVAYLRVANVQRGELILDEIKTMQIEKEKLNDLKLEKYDILFNEGGDRDKLGRGWIWESQVEPCITQNHVFRATTYLGGEFHSKFISHWGNTFGRDYFEKGGKQTTNLASINKTVLSKFPIPMPSLEEQIKIIQVIDTTMSKLDSNLEDIEESIKKSQALRQSILKKAFSGRLVPQDPNDEPASELLKRIAIEKAELASKTKASVKKTKSRLKSKQASSSSA
ncbi:MAG: restriction endonuclease subunit S [Gammaproteobacteria bacterium]